MHAVLEALTYLVARHQHPHMEALFRWWQGILWLAWWEAPAGRISMRGKVSQSHLQYLKAYVQQI